MVPVSIVTGVGGGTILQVLFCIALFAPSDTSSVLGSLTSIDLNPLKMGEMNTVPNLTLFFCQIIATAVIRHCTIQQSQQ